MASSLKDQKTAVAEIVKYGDKITLPEKMSLPDAIKVITRRMEYEEETTQVVETFDAFPWDGAYSFDLVLQDMYGWVPQRGASIAVEVDYDKKVQVSWGAFELPNIQGVVKCGAAQDGRMMKFQLTAQVKRKYEPEVRRIYAAVRAKILTHSIYRGKAIQVQFLDDDGDAIGIPMPKFLDTSKVNPSALILSRHLEKAVNDNLFVPLTRLEDCIANGIATKRGVLLGGTFGTGKTMIATIASKLAVDAGITFLSIKHAAELAMAIEFAKQYQNPGSVIFVEDIDRAMAGERTDKMDQILNTLDGIDSKSMNIIVVATTNDLLAINPATVRPGRLDAVIEITAPDAEAIERLIRAYAGSSVDASTDLTAVGEALAGNIPAVIAEVVKRAKLAQLGLQARGTKVTELSAEALLNAALSIRAQVALLNPKKAEERPSLDAALAEVVNNTLNGTKERIDRIYRSVC
jgi:transitional endoplasmic reticulum ATPase